MLAPMNSPSLPSRQNTYVMISKVTALEHKLRDYTMEGRAHVSKALGMTAKLREVSGSPWDVLIEKLEIDAPFLVYTNLVSK